MTFVGIIFDDIGYHTLTYEVIHSVHMNFRCKICYIYKKKYSITSQHPTKLGEQNGDIKPNRRDNNAMMKNHKNTVTHKAAVSERKKEYLDELNNIKHTEQRKNWVTNRVMRTVYYSVMNNIPFNNHKSLVALQESNEAKMGHRCKSRAIAKKMAISISDKMHQEVLTFMKEKQPYFSLIMDESKSVNFCQN